MDRHEGKFEQVDRQAEQRGVEHRQRIEADRIAEIRRSAAGRPPESEAATGNDRQRSQESMKEGEARQRHLGALDREILTRIERRFGQDIPPERLQLARNDPARFLDHQSYEAHLQKSGLEPSRPESRVLGDFQKGHVYADFNHPELPRTLAHERLHQLADASFQEHLGGKLNEGVSEYLSSRVSPDLHIRDSWESYSSERRLAEMLDARVGEKAIAQAYFKGDWRSLETQLEAQLGTGALDRLAQAGQLGSYEEAERVLKGEG